MTPVSDRAAFVVPTRRQILIRAQQQIDRVCATSLPFELRIERGFDYLLQAGRDLDRLAAHERAASR